MKTYVDVFKALSDGNRLRIMAALLRAGTELCICEIMDTLDIAQYNVSRYVKELRVAGLLEERREGRFVFYSVAKPRTAAGKYLIKALESIKDDTAAGDHRRLTQRLALREKGKCVVGMRGCK
ncbi:MAG: ArsR/SmtB family transcription factor [Endomicrobiales bacterium]